MNRFGILTRKVLLQKKKQKKKNISLLKKIKKSPYLDILSFLALKSGK